MSYCAFAHLTCASHLRTALAHLNDTHSTPIIRTRIYHPNDDAFSHPSSVKLPPLATALFNSLTISGRQQSILTYAQTANFYSEPHTLTVQRPPASFHSRPHLLSVNAPPNISASDLRDGDSRYRHSFIRPDSSAAVVRQGCRPASGRCRRHPAVNGDTFGIRTSICLRVPSPCRSSL